MIVWPLQKPDLFPCKFLHEFTVGNGVDVKQLALCTDLRKPFELAVWGTNLCLEELSVFDFKWNTVKIFGAQWQFRFA